MCMTGSLRGPREQDSGSKEKLPRPVPREFDFAVQICRGGFRCLHGKGQKPGTLARCPRLFRGEKTRQEDKLFEDARLKKRREGPSC